MQRETAIQVARDMWGCVMDHDGHTIFPLQVIRSFLNGAYVCVEASNLPLDHVIDLNSSEFSKLNESLNVDELISIVDVIAKAQVIESEFDISVYDSTEFRTAPLPPTVVFIEVGLPRPSRGQINWYREICGERNEITFNFENLATRWETAFAKFSPQEEIGNLIVDIRSCLQRTMNDEVDISEALLGTYLFDLRVSGFVIPNMLPDIISNHVKLWFIEGGDSLQLSNAFLGLFPASRANHSEVLIDRIISRLFSKLSVPRMIAQKPETGEEAPARMELTKRKISHESCMSMMRLLCWIPADPMTLPQLPNAYDVEEFSRGHFIGPTLQKFHLEWDKRPGVGWNYAAIRMFIQAFMEESQSYSKALMSESDLQKQIFRRFSYLKRKRKEGLVRRDGTDSEREKLREETAAKLKAKRRRNRRKALFEHRLAIVSATPEWPPNVARTLACLKTDGTSSDETDSDTPKQSGNEITYRRVPKLFRSPEIDKFVRAIDIRGTELSKRKRVGQPFRKRTGDHPNKVNSIIVDGLPKNFYNLNWLSKHRPDAMSLLRIGVLHPIPPLLAPN